jgi:hypothetical protein
MIRIEMLQKAGDEFYTVGLYELFPDTFFALTSLDNKPALVNPYMISFSKWTGEKRLLTHIGFFPVMEYTGIVSQLTAPIWVDKDGVVSFAAGSISMSMVMDDQSGITVIKGTP